MAGPLHAAISGLTLSHLRHFLLVANKRNFREAAELAFRSQPAISLSIKEMESRIGAALFDREKGLELTPVGRECLPLVASFLAQHDKLSCEIERLASGSVGSISIGCAPICHSAIAAAIAKFQSEGRDVRLSVMTDNPTGLARRLRAFEIDICICPFELDVEGLSFTPLVRKPYGVLCPTDHALAAKAFVSWDELATVELIGSAFLTDPSFAARMRPLRFGPLHVTSLQLMMEIVSQRLGITVLPEYAAPLSASNLVFVPLADPLIESSVGLLKSRLHPLSPAASQFERVALEVLTVALA